mmetsp:Transcript_62037/g.128353  ORF Transcript_62037/g.128353 Transcript_62037/m.128353 type:complete len:246 (-) Transcript_62037:1563-2300(-)
MRIRHLDVVTAFLYPRLKEKMYMLVPEDIAAYPGEIVELFHSIYGTRQAAHNWYKELIAALRAFGMQPAVDEETVFVTTVKGRKLIVVMFVDDIIVIHNDDQLFKRFLKHLQSKFEITDEGDLQWYLGVYYQRSADGATMTASQASYIDRLATTFGGERWQPTKTPMEEKFSVREQDVAKEHDPKLESEYHKLLGSLLFLSCWSRPDISVAVTKLARVGRRVSTRTTRPAYSCLGNLSFGSDPST